MHFPFLPRAAGLALAAAGCAILPGWTHAQGAAWSPVASLTTVYQGSANLDGGGDYSAWTTLVRAGVIGDLGGGKRAGLVFHYDHSDYDFSNPAAFGGAAPWGVVQRYGASAPLSFSGADGWTLGLSPSVDWVHEKGADTGESLTWGATAFAMKAFPGGNRLGLGVGIFDRPGETKVFPLVIVDWQLSDRWRLVNPLPAGPTGPAGLELVYRLDNGWNIGAGAAWRSTRFRLSSNGAVPNGIGEEEGVPVFVRASRSVGAGGTLNLYAGIVTAGKLSVMDSSGQVLRETDSGTAPLIGATFSMRF